MCMRAKSLQSCLTRCDGMHRSLPDFSVHGILPARILEWVACPPPGDLSDPGIEPPCLLSTALAGRLSLSPPGKLWKCLLGIKVGGLYLVIGYATLQFRGEVQLGKKVGKISGSS